VAVLLDATEKGMGVKDGVVPDVAFTSLKGVRKQLLNRLKNGKRLFFCFIVQKALR
jgi:hypothetical protein